MSCRKAIGVATKMQVDFADAIEVKIHTTDSEEARGYVFRGSTTVFLDDKLVPLQTALEPAAMRNYLEEHI